MAVRNAPRSREDRRQPSRQEQRRQQRRQGQARQQRRPSRRPLYLIGAIVVILAVLGAGAYFVLARDSSHDASLSNLRGGTLRPNTAANIRPGGAIHGMSCLGEMLNYHIHAALTLYNNGTQVTLPALIGIPISKKINVGGSHYCLYPLHTHATDSIAHIESPTVQTYTLGQFIDVWAYTARWDAQGGLAQSQGVSVDPSFVNALQAAKPGAVHVFVNGTLARIPYRDIPLTAHASITIEIGASVRPPAKSFSFPTGD